MNDDNLERDRLAAEEDFTTPALLRCISSSVVYNSKSPVMPEKSMSMLVKGPTVMKEPSFLYWGHGMVQHGSTEQLSLEIALYQTACL